MPVHLRTTRLHLRPFTEADAPFLVALNSDPEVTRYTGDGPVTLLHARQVVTYVTTRQHPFGMARLIVEEGGEPVGWCGLRRLEPGQIPDLGYRFLRSAWGRGLATEASRAVLDHGFSRPDVPEVEAVADVANSASIGVMRKLGMTWHGERVEEDTPVVVYRLTREAWML